MEKVKLTPEEAAFVEEWNSIKTRFANIARALTEGYEIESEQPEFKSGDKVTPLELEFDEKRRILTLMKLKDDTKEEAWWYENHEWDYANDFRQATPEEIYWFETLGRDKVKDFRIGDVLIGSDQCSYVVGMKTEVESGFLALEDLDTLIPRLNVKGIMPYESYKRFPKEESNGTADIRS